MIDTDQLDYLATRERQQRAFAARARDDDIRRFHERLVEHYAHLAAEVRRDMTAPPGP